MRRAALIACLAGSLAWTTGTVNAADLQLFRPLVTAIHVHSTASTGTLDLDALAERAEHLGIEALLLSENLALRYEYGLEPLRGTFKVSLSFPSLVTYGVKRYLKEVHDVQARHPGVLLIPGLEVAPHYYWTGSLWTRDLTMHDAQKNFLVFGLHEAGRCCGTPGSWQFLLIPVQSVSLIRPIARLARLACDKGLVWTSPFFAHDRSSRASRKDTSRCDRIGHIGRLPSVQRMAVQFITIQSLRYDSWISAISDVHRRRE